VAEQHFCLKEGTEVQRELIFFHLGGATMRVLTQSMKEENDAFMDAGDGAPAESGVSRG